MQPSSNPTPESQSGGTLPEVPAIAPEVQPAASVQPPVPTAQPDGPPVIPPSVAATPVSPPANIPVAGPNIAGDVDVIEKEWVDKADAVVIKNAGNPHAEEEAVEQLQVDYLKKRYNKDVKQSDG